MSSTATLIASRRYPVEEHEVVTQDEYCLTLHRIPKPESDKVVLVMHGFLTSSADWVINPPGQALGFDLFDAGYDVWMGNWRGNNYSRRHVSLSPKSPQFWNFSFDEMAQYDLPAMIDYILHKTKQSQIYYIGFSMGTTAAFGLLSEKKEYNEKIKVFMAIGPVTTLSHTMSFIKYAAPLAPYIGVLLNWVGLHDMMSNSHYLVRLLQTLPQKLLGKPGNMLCLVNGASEKQVAKYRMPEINVHTPSGTSSKNFIHFAQIINSKIFRKFDYGKAMNVKKYKEKTPPEYPVEKVSVPVAIIWSLNDFLADPVDVALLKDRLSNVVLFHQVEQPTWGHLDFIWSHDAHDLVYTRVIDVLKKY